MDDLIARILGHLHGRLDGPMWFRFILQPTIASILAIRAGLKDGREGKPAYFWAILTDAANRQAMLREGFSAVIKIFILAVVLDGIYQYIVFRWFYPFETLVVAFMLAFVPYLLIRGPVGRLASSKKSK